MSMEVITHSALIVAVAAIVTASLRFLPFWIFSSEDKTPKVLYYLGKVLPGAIMGMLVIYCLRGTNVMSWPFGLPELIAGGMVVISYIWKKNTLVSIGLGTVLYMFLVQSVFV